MLRRGAVGVPQGQRGQDDKRQERQRDLSARQTAVMPMPTPPSAMMADSRHSAGNDIACGPAHWIVT